MNPKKLPNIDWDTFSKQGYLVIESAFAPETLIEIRDCFQEHISQKRFRPARIGRGTGEASLPARRGDAISWLDPKKAIHFESTLLNLWEELRVELNRNLFLSLTEFEGHFARYEENSHYEKHRDQFQSDDRRTISSVLYLNENWRPTDGGELVLYLKSQQEVRIAPTQGTLLLFRSEFEHEVLTSRCERWSFTGWFKVRQH